jgi:DNA polymerase elongation subunit (family B)
MQENELKTKLENIKQQVKNESDKDSIMRIEKKLVANSFYPVVINDVFYFNSKELADKVAKEGKKQIKILIDIMSGL